MSEKLRVIRQLCENWCYHDGKPADVIGEVLAVLDGVDEAPSDPKHLPPRDCEVWFQDEKDRAEGKAPYWMEVRFESADGETVYDDIIPHTVWHPDRWRIPYSDEILDPADVITWRELPEVE